MHGCSCRRQLFVLYVLRNGVRIELWRVPYLSPTVFLQLTGHGEGVVLLFSACYEATTALFHILLRLPCLSSFLS
jgi:hypothetical protein